MTDKFLSFLGICRRANALCTGHDAVKDAVRSEKAVLVILASDASPRLEREMKNLSPGINILKTDCTMKDIGCAVGKQAGILAVTDANFAQPLLKKYEEGIKYGS